MFRLGRAASALEWGHDGGVMVMPATPKIPVPRQGDRTDPKAAALLADGALNPSPEKVSDPKFQAGDFFDPRDLVQVRYEMLRRVSVDAISVTQVSGEYGVSRPTYYQAKASFGEVGLVGLVPKKRGPRGPHKLRGDLLAFVEKCIVPGKPLRARELARLIRKEFSVEVHPRTIERAYGRKKATGRYSPKTWPYRRSRSASRSGRCARDRARRMILRRLSASR